MERAFGLAIPQSVEEACDPRRVALIVYDMQGGILRHIERSADLIASVVRVLQAARQAGVRVFFLRHMSLPKELMGVFQLRMALAWQRVRTVAEVPPWFLRDTPDFHLVPEVIPLPSEAMLDKLTFSAFEGTPLNIALRDCGINTVILVGVATEMGLEPTGRHGCDLGDIPILVTDACGAGDQEAGARALASLRFMGDAFFTTVEEICGVLLGKANRSA
jgi:nicotinamidase-related amidase